MTEGLRPQKLILASPKSSRLLQDAADGTV